MFRQRLRVLFTKERLARFLGHHDLMRLWERALRRAGLPLHYSAGFNPRPQISFPTALALGFESREEVFEVELERWVSPRRAQADLQRELPEGIGIRRVQSVPHAGKAQITGTEFTVQFTEPPPDFAALLEVFLQKAEVLVERTGKSGTKSVDVRRFVNDASYRAPTLTVNIAIAPDGTARPDEVVAAVLGVAPAQTPRMRVTRTRLTLQASPQT